MPIGVVNISETSEAVGFNENNFIDGYVNKSGNEITFFPVGHGNFYGPFEAGAIGTEGAYFHTDPNAATLPAGGPFNIQTKDGDIKNVSNKEYWDINGTNATQITLSWNAESDLTTLTANDISSITIAGWNVISARWEKINSVIDQVSLLGTASSITSGSITTIQSIVPNQYNIFTLASMTASVVAPDYEGLLQTASCSEVRGWVWDKKHADAELTVELLEGSMVYAAVKANQYIAELKNSGVGTGNYGFIFQVPQQLRDGAAHQFSIRVRSSSYVLPGSPKTTSCNFDGLVEKTDCYTLSGWARNKDNDGEAVIVEILEGSVLHATVTANQFRADLKNAGMGTGNYGFSIARPAALQDGRQHQLTFRIKNTAYRLSNQAVFDVCNTPLYQGVFDVASCNELKGWAWDKNNPYGPALTVEILEAGNVIATATADLLRAELITLGTGTSKYGFSLPLPAALRDGQPHTLTVRVKGSSTILNNTKIVTCNPLSAYQGTFEAASCNELKGWAWDKNNPNAPALVVELIEAGRIVATVNADIYREDLKNAGTGTGKYGFSTPFPALLRDGKPHTVTARVKGTTFVLEGAKDITCPPPSLYQGVFDVASCNELKGWAWDKNNPYGPALTVEILEAGNVIATATADLLRAELITLGTGTSKYGFSLPLPAALRDGQPHTLTVRVKGSSTILNNTKIVTCNPLSAYQGTFETASCTELKGWAWDKNNPNAPAMVVELIEAGRIVATVNADIYREDLKNAGTGTGKYGFSTPFPALLRDGKPHTVTARVKGTTFVLEGAKDITCPPPSLYQGVFDVASCNELKGWAWDKNNPYGPALTVEILEAGNVIATATADLLRAELITLGTGTSKYGFSLPLPAALRDGQPHTLTVRVKGSSTILNNTKIVTCNPVSAYQGTFEAASCTELKGWVSDKNNPNAPAMVVELIEAGRIVATVNADIYREDLKNAGTGTGKYGFSTPFPALLRDGKPHTITARVKATTFVLEGAKDITCPPPSLYQGVFDVASCNELKGWAWDKNNPYGPALTVEILEAGNVIATATADLLRAELITLGTGTSKYGFSLPLPAALRDGQPHTLTVRVKGSSTILNNTKIVTCNPVAAYQGTFEDASCTELKGWAWDKNNPNAPALVVELIEAGRIVATVNADIYREDLKNAGTGTGKYGFSTPFPALLRDGKPHTLTARVKATTFVLEGAKDITCPPPSLYQGVFDVASCNELKGWAWDKNNPYGPALTVEILEAGNVIATATADLLRAELITLGTGTSKYGFSLPLPAALRDGQPHTLTVRVKGSSTILNNTKIVTCNLVSAYQGTFETASCTELKGWAWDKNNPNALALVVELIEAGRIVATVNADIYREDLKNAGTGTGKYGFSTPFPALLRDGKPHTVTARVKATTFVLEGAKDVTCPPPSLYQGVFDVASCNELKGWAWDKNNPYGPALTVEILEAGNVIATATADLLRAELVTLGTGTSKYGFSLPLPAALRDGQPHTLTVRVKGSSTILNNTKIVTCNPLSAYQGTFETASCTELKGWAWDKNNPNAPALVVELIEAGRIVATVNADIYREDLKNAGTGTGKYGFSTAFPALLRDGKPHTITARVKGTTFVLEGAKDITCPPPSLYQGVFDVASCNELKGWAWDKNNPYGPALTVEILEADNVIATATADLLRAELITLGTGTSKYGFSLPLPAALRDGQPHTLTVRVKGSSTILNNTKIVTCQSTLREIAAPEIASQVKKELVELDERPTNSDFELTVSPNPTNGLLTIKAWLAKNKKAQLSITNLTGRTVWQQSTIGSGESYQIQVDLSSHGTGTYVVSLRTADATLVKRIVLIK
ncbi:T9SS type A sorting domain-containing protein [Dyadobacter sp. CY326]|uniref:T9SS type A sorting domain-containing protein n=1 Tax=Dyadobacter sp. CY326 TaxID=2907300 RepID=UPI001F44E9C7|nr:T9SS type A sorting domain-containing protein [Dyadobacter sp. CY326]MCE7066146.1 T9SS type A sorting domain-containing protein [Dyadobacter sp. CY326]